MKFTPIVIEIDEDSPHYEVPYGHYVRVGVRDSGRGMDEETRSRCFEPFFTTHNVDPSTGIGMSGAGLGLAAAYALSRRNGGRLVVDSRLGHGSVFTLYLPVFEEDVDRPVLEVARRTKTFGLSADGKREVQRVADERLEIEKINLTNSDEHAEASVDAPEPKISDILLGDPE